MAGPQCCAWCGQTARMVRTQWSPSMAAHVCSPLGTRSFVVYLYISYYICTHTHTHTHTRTHTALIHRCIYTQRRFIQIIYKKLYDVKTWRGPKCTQTCNNTPCNTMQRMRSRANYAYSIYVTMDCVMRP